MIRNITPPAPDEYAPFYSDYVERSRRSNVLELLAGQAAGLHALLDPLSEEQACFRFGPTEWSIKEVTGHLTDVERVFSYRLLRISRNDATPLPGFEQDDYVRAAGFDACALRELLEEFELARRANLLAIQRLDDDSLNRRGTASGAGISVRALVYLLAGHVEHHVASLHANYLPRLA